MRHLLAVAVFVSFIPSAFAQLSTLTPPPRPSSPTPLTYGTSSDIKLQIPGSAFTACDTANTKLEDGSAQYYSSNTGRLTAGVNLPSGAILEEMQVYYDDTDATSDPFVALFSTSGTTANNLNVVASAAAPNSGVAGKGVASSGPLSAVIDNDNTQYQLFVYATTSAAKVRAVSFRYKLQVSPAPATATFNDVPLSSPINKFVEALAKSGITAGCGNGNYCPNDPVTRGQMAVFLSVALGLHWAP